MGRVLGVCVLRGEALGLCVGGVCVCVGSYEGRIHMCVCGGGGVGSYEGRIHDSKPNPYFP